MTYDWLIKYLINEIIGLIFKGPEWKRSHYINPLIFQTQIVNTFMRTRQHLIENKILIALIIVSIWDTWVFLPAHFILYLYPNRQQQPRVTLEQLFQRRFRASINEEEFAINNLIYTRAQREINKTFSLIFLHSNS